MRRATENQGDTRTFTDYFSPKSKVKDQALQQRSSFQETPMKPSQVPNQLPHPPPRRMLPLQSPELWHKDRLGPPRYPHQHHLGPYSPGNIGSAAHKPNLTPRNRLGPPHHSAQPPGSFRTRLVPVSPVNHGTTAYRLQPSSPGIFHPANHQFMKDLSDQSPSSHIRRDQVTESKVPLSYSGCTNITGQRQESNKAHSSDVRSSVPTVQLHRPPVTPLLNSGADQDVYPLLHSDSEHWSPGISQWPSTQPSHRTSSSSVPIMQSPVAACQDQHHQQTPSSEELIPGVDLYHLSQKRRREFEDCDDSAKKLCLEGGNSDKAQTPKPTVDNTLSASLVSQPPSRPSSVSQLSHKTTEPACQSAYLELSSTIKQTQSSCTSLSPNPCIKKRPSMGAKQAYINSSHNHTVKLIEVRSPSKPGEEHLKKKSEVNDKREKPSSLSLEVPQKDTGHTYRSTSALPVKTPSRGNQVEECRKSDSTTPKPASKPNSLSLSCRTAERNKTSRPRRPVPSPDDISELFTPDPLKYVVSPAHKTVKPKTDGETIKSSTSQKSGSSSTVSGSSTTGTGSSCHKTQDATANSSPHEVDTKVSSLSSAGRPEVFLPTVALERVKLENLRSFSPRDSELKNSPTASSSVKPYKEESVQFNTKHTSLLPNSLRPCALETNCATSKQTCTSHCTPLLEGEASHREVIEEDPIDVELDLGLSFALDMDLTQSSHSSEEEHLLSLQEMMERAYKPPDTPEKAAFSEPSTPGHPSSKPKTQLLPSTTKTGTYKNNLDQMLKEINTNKRAKEIEIQLLTACKEDLLRIAEYEEAEENREEGISTEHQEFLQRYSLMSSAIREVPPGEVVFNLEKFGRIFNHDTLKLRQCMVNPQGTTQKMLLWSSPSLLRFHVNIGLFQEAYDSRSPCPVEVTRFLFKMMSVHNERMVSSQIQQALCDIACTAAYQIVKNGSKLFKVWVPSLADVALVLMNMGVAFVTLFPFENLQPPFTEGDLLADIYIKSESPSSSSQQSTFPEHNCNNILKYLSYCMDLCPRAYSDDELLLLLTVVGRVGLDTRLILQSSVELYPLQSKLVRNIRDWENMLPRICLALTDLTDDHHNMCLLVQLLPYNTRGKQLRRHLSLSMISKLLDGNCTYRPTEPEIKLSELRPYLLRMQPSALLRGMLSSSGRSHKDEEDMVTLDQQAYYLCYSLLTLANEASNFQFFPAHQKEQLLSLCSELETHVKCDIRESEKCLYRSKVKDLVARIYTKWQMLLQRTRPLHGKLYDYWQPLPVDTLTRSQEEQEMDSCEDGEGPVMEEGDNEEEEETSGTEENDVLMIADDEKEEGEEAMDDKKETGDQPKPEDEEVDNMMERSNEKEKATDSVHGEVDEEMQEMEPQVHTESEVMDGQMEAGNMEHTEVETKNLVERRETSKQDQEAVI